MKKKILLFALAAVMAFSAIGASATSLRGIYPVEDSYSFTYNVGAANETAQYGMIVVKGTGDNVDMDEILYIGQAVADETGNIAFTNFAPMGEAPSDYEGSEDGDGDEDYFEECTVYIGGKSIGDTTQAIGILKNASGVPVTGTVVDGFSSRKATVTIYSGSDALASAKTLDDGTFSITIGGGEDLSVEFKKTAYLTFTYTGVDVTGAVDLGEVDMSNLAGDIDMNKTVELADLQKILAYYGDAVTSNDEIDPNADIDDNGTLELKDLQAVLSIYGENVKSVAYTPAQ